MKRENKKILMIMLTFVFVILMLTGVSYAASFSATTSTTSVKVGDSVTITVKANNAAGMYKVSVDDSSVLALSSGSASEFLENSSQKIVFKAKKAGTAKITATASDMTDLDDSSKKVTGNKTFTIKVTDSTSGNNAGSTGNNNNSGSTTTTTKKSNNANLKTLGVTPKEYDFSGFSKSKTEYSVTVPNNVDSLKVAYKTEDSKASVKVSGDSGFEVGSNNQIKVVVTAEDGKTTKTYTIKVTKLAEDEEKPGNIIDDDKNDGLYLTSLIIKGIELSPKFAKDTYSYTATLEDSSVNELKVEAKANNEKANIAISGNTNLEDGENTINIILTLDDSSEQTIYQVVVNKEAAALPTTTSAEITPTSNNDFMGSIKTYLWVAIVVIVLVVVAVIVLIILLRRENRRLKDEDMDDEEYDVFKNDANEFQNKNENFIASLYKQKDDNSSEEELSQTDKETLEEINKQTNDIFKDKVQGQSVEYSEELEERKNRKDRGRHF